MPVRRSPIRGISTSKNWVFPQTVNRWRRKQNPPDNSSLLVLTMMTQDPTPLIVMDRLDLVGGTISGAMIYSHLSSLSLEMQRRLVNELRAKDANADQIWARVKQLTAG